MSDLPHLALAFVVGAVFGAIFFGGLWWTVQKAVASELPAAWFVGSLLSRTCLILTGFYLVGEGHWSRIVACFLGFLMARFLVVRKLSRATAVGPIELETEANDAHQSR
jgi:F1F0 ATPase subunit 2